MLRLLHVVDALVVSKQGRQIMFSLMARGLLSIFLPLP